ncbi:hypothetical protein J1N35_022687 [Gossypium stocksii]|uniref:Uncharacterized protein n=1 Tax=Gossypium stocksii TaxID=47602 RepID=A0A9D4A1D6_9ROSI|nr:hypothetical protein J1N35_022687 [Gossypium stocksii]
MDMKRKGMARFSDIKKIIMEVSGGQYERGVGGVPTGGGLVVSTPKFKWRRVSTIRDFLP